MQFRKEQRGSWFLLDTAVENVYISEYMASSPGDYVKVYLLALMYANLGETCGVKAMAKQLKVSEQTVQDAWVYWESLGAVRKINKKDNGDYGIEFISLKESLCNAASPKKAKGEEKKAGTGKPLEDNELSEMYGAIEKILGRPFKASEPPQIVSWIDMFGATAEMIIYAYNYCKKTRKKDSVNYVGAVVKEWAEHDLYTTEKIEDFLSENDRRYYMHKRILKALGFSRNATEREVELMNGWFDKYGFTIDRVLEACKKTSGISNPNFNYVNKVLMGWKEAEEAAGGGDAGGVKTAKPVTEAVISKYYDHLRKKAQAEKENRREEIYAKLPQIKEYDESIRKKSMELSRCMLGGNKKGAAELRGEIEGLMAEIAGILTENNYPADYMEDKYLCPICKDTGTADTGERCSCFMQRREEAQEWQISLTN